MVHGSRQPPVAVGPVRCLPGVVVATQQRRERWEIGVSETSQRQSACAADTPAVRLQNAAAPPQQLHHQPHRKRRFAIAAKSTLASSTASAFIIAGISRASLQCRRPYSSLNPEVYIKNPPTLSVYLIDYKQNTRFSLVEMYKINILRTNWPRKKAHENFFNMLARQVIYAT